MNTYSRLDGKTALITGAASGIGRAIAIRYAREGADIAVVDINLEGAIRVAKEIGELGRKSKAYRTDVSQNEQVQQLVKDFYSDFEVLDILVNNAGIGGTMSRILSLKEEKFDHILNVNLKSCFLMCKKFGKKMKKRKVAEDQLKGKIINMSSMRGKTGRAMYGDYSISKFGVIALTQTLAQELGRSKITVNAICPGLIHTPFYGNATYDSLASMNEKMLGCLPHKPVGLVGDVAGTAIHIASDDCNWVTGQSFPVAGGQGFV